MKDTTDVYFVLTEHSPFAVTAPVHSCGPPCLAGAQGSAGAGECGGQPQPTPGQGVVGVSPVPARSG